MLIFAHRDNRIKSLNKKWSLVGVKWSLVGGNWLVLVDHKWSYKYIHIGGPYIGGPYINIHIVVALATLIIYLGKVRKHPEGVGCHLTRPSADHPPPSPHFRAIHLQPTAPFLGSHVYTAGPTFLISYIYTPPNFPVSYVGTFPNFKYGVTKL